jgi:hypothetical protein
MTFQCLVCTRRMDPEVENPRLSLMCSGCGNRAKSFPEGRFSGAIGGQRFNPLYEFLGDIGRHFKPGISILENSASGRRV